MKEFVLVGDTALALQIGHRISIDIDLFTNHTFNENAMADYFRSAYHFELDFISKNTIKGEISGVQVDCTAHQYPWLNLPIKEENIRLASPEDIAAMKLNAIAGNGSRIKDFIDLAYLSGTLTFNQMLSAYETKYKSNPVIPLKALNWFDEINFDEPIKMAHNAKFNWKIIANRLKKMHNAPDKKFSSLT